MASRDPFFDACKGIGIFFVMMIHSIKLDFVSAESRSLMLVASRQLINFAVPIFFFMSAYLSFDKSLTAAPRGFYIHRAKRILVPYVSWSMIFLVLSAVLYKAPFSWGDALFKLLTGQAQGPYCFIVVLLQLTVIGRFLARRERPNITLFAMSVMGALWMSWVYSVKSHSNSTLVFPYYALPFIAWGHFYYLGIYVRKAKVSLRSSYCFSIAVVFLLASLIEARFWVGRGNVELAASALKFSSQLYSAFLILGLYQARGWFTERIRDTSWLPRLGRNSYGLYLIHAFFISIWAGLYSRFVSQTEPLTYFLGCVIFTLICSTVSVGLIQRASAVMPIKTALGV